MAVLHDDTPTSPTLLTSIANGEQPAWERFVRIYAPLILRWCERSGLQSSDAQDVTQNVLFSVNDSIEKFERRPHDGSFRAWLWGLCRHKIADARRGRPGDETVIGGTDAVKFFTSVPDVARLPSEPPETEDDIADLHLRVLTELKLSFSEDVWTAFWRSTIDGDAPKDIAEDLGTSVWAVYKAKARVLARLKADFGEEFQIG